MIFRMNRYTIYLRIVWLLEFLASGFEYITPSNRRRAHLSEDDKWRILKAEKVVRSRLSDPLSISKLAQVVGLNTFKLKEGFKELFGRTIFANIIYDAVDDSDAF